LIPQHHPLAEWQQISASELAKEFLISFEPETPHSAAVSELFRSIRPAPKIGVRHPTYRDRHRLVANGMGIAVVDEFAVADSATLPFSVVRVKGGPRIHIYLSWKREVVRSHFF